MNTLAAAFRVVLSRKGPSRLWALALLLLSLTAISSPSFGQTGTTSLGTDFWIGMMPNYLGPAENIRVFVASSSVNTVHCDFFGGSSQPVDTRTATTKANDIVTFFQYATALAETRVPEKAAFRAIHVYSKNPIAVYAITNSGATTDSYLGIPVQALGTDYLPSCYYDDMYNGIPDPLAGEFLIIAPYDDTRVHIGPVRCATRLDPSGTVSHDAGDQWDVTLQKGQTYLVQSTGLNFGDDDLTGTPIKSDKPIGLISGHQRCSIPIGAPNDSKDHLCEMIPSTDRWGTEYFDMPMAARTLCGDYIRLIAGEDNVRITENGKQVAVLGKKGDFVDRELVLDPVRYLSVDANGLPSKKKFLTVQHSYTDFYNGDQGQGDPFSIVMTPREQFQKRLLFRCPNNKSSGGTYIHYLTFICEQDSISKIMLNGKRITSYSQAGMAQIPGTSNPVMAAIRLKSLSGDITYLATCGAPFAAYIYGFTDVESYGHPAGMALNVITPDPIAPAEVRDSVCGTFTVQLQELRHMKPVGKYDFEDSRINEVAMITDSNDLRWDFPSYNFNFEFDPKHPFTPGDSIAYYTLTVIDPTKDGYAAVWTTDRAGNDSIYEYYYHAPKVSIEPNENPVMYAPVTVGADSCRRFVFRNLSFGALDVTDLFVMDSAKAGKFRVTPSGVHQKLQPNDSLVFTVCFTPSDTLTSDDTLVVQTECVPFKYALEGIGVTPIILADDLDFAGVVVGDTACKDLRIKNIGNAPLIIDKNWILNNTTHFFFRDDAALPVTIMPGQSRTFRFCYAPDGPHADSGLQNWGTNIKAPFAHQKKDSSILSGYGLQPGLNWDRPSENYTVECADTLMQRVNLINSSSGAGATSLRINKVQIEGPDAAEFTIVDNSKHYLPLELTPPWPLDSNESVWIDITFKPDLNKAYRTRNAKIVAYGQDAGGKLYQPELALTGTIRHAEVRLTPTSVDFGVVNTNSPLSTDIWIHNDGDTDLVIGTLTLTNGYQMSGVNIGDKVKPGDSVKVTVTGTAPDGVLDGTLTVNGTTQCTTVANSMLTVFGTRSGFAATGHDYGDVYVCKDGTAQITASNTAARGTILQSVQILDTLGSAGANQYTFENGRRDTLANAGIDAGSSINFNVKFKPAVGGGQSAHVLYTFIDTTASPDTLVHVLRELKGNPLFYQTVLSTHKDYGDQVYSAHTGEEVSVPVQMKMAFDPKASVYGITFDLRYRRDEFTFQRLDLPSGLNLTGTPTVTQDVADPRYELVTATVTSASPITKLDTIGHAILRYNIALDSATQIQVQNVRFYDNQSATGVAPCWVVSDTISGTFLGQDYCGNKTIRDVMAGNNPVFSIQKVTPNPVTGSASLGYDVHVNGAPVTIEIFDVLGNKVATVLSAKVHQMGSYSVRIDGSHIGSGTYIVRASSMGFVVSQQLVIKK